MSIRHYFDFGSWAVWKTSIAAGVDAAYTRDRGMVQPMRVTMAP